MRVIEYRLEGIKGAENFYRLATTMLDPDEAPAQELAALYGQRWEIESALDELKTHWRGGRIVLRGQTAELVRQEFYGLLMAHCAIRELLHEAPCAPTKTRTGSRICMRRGVQRKMSGCKIRPRGPLPRGRIDFPARIRIIS